VSPRSKISTALKTTCERIAPSKSFLDAAPFITTAGYIVVMKFTGRHWLALATSNLQSSRTTQLNIIWAFVILMLCIIMLWFVTVVGRATSNNGSWYFVLVAVDSPRCSLLSQLTAVWLCLWWYVCHTWQQGPAPRDAYSQLILEWLLGYSNAQGLICFVCSVYVLLFRNWFCIFITLSLCLWLASSCSITCQLTTRTIHNSLSLSLPVKWVGFNVPLNTL